MRSYTPSDALFQRTRSVTFRVANFSTKCQQPCRVNRRFRGEFTKFRAGFPGLGSHVRGHFLGVSLQVLTTLPEGAMLEWVSTFRKAPSLESPWIWPCFNLFEKVNAELEKLRSDFAQVRTEMLNERVIRAEHHLGF